MTDWLAIIVVCASGECAFWADLKTPYNSRESCQRQVVAMSKYFKENNAEPILATCLPIKFVKV